MEMNSITANMMRIHRDIKRFHESTSQVTFKSHFLESIKKQLDQLPPNKKLEVSFVRII